MARLDRIKRRLENWAMWKAKGASGGVGFATRSVLLSDTWSRGSYNGMSIPVFDQDAELTNAAIESFRLTRSHLHLTLQCMYIKDLGVKGTAEKMHCAVSTVHANLAHADAAIDAWLDARQQDLERKRVASEANEKSFTP